MDAKIKKLSYQILTNLDKGDHTFFRYSCGCHVLMFQLMVKQFAYVISVDLELFSLPFLRCTKQVVRRNLKSLVLAFHFQSSPSTATQPYYRPLKHCWDLMKGPFISCHGSVFTSAAAECL